MPTTRKSKPLSARSADKLALYEAAVQCPQAEVDFLSRQFLRIRKRPALSLREDFCGTAAVACLWASSRSTRTAVGLDLHAPTLAVGRSRHLAALTPTQQTRVSLFRANVLTPPPAARGPFDLIAALNFSYWVFHDRPTLTRYFASARSALASDGLLAIDLFGGSDSMIVQTEPRRCKGFTYIWDQHAYDPASARYDCRIHFRFPDGSTLKNAFRYDWRLWTTPELREVLLDAGFRKLHLFAEGDDGRGGGNGIYRQVTSFHPDKSFVAYILAQP